MKSSMCVKLFQCLKTGVERKGEAKSPRQVYVSLAIRKEVTDLCWGN
jgi:hypothetical protein